MIAQHEQESMGKVVEEGIPGREKHMKRPCGMKTNIFEDLKERQNVVSISS
jgi:hypothetical protein